MGQQRRWANNVAHTAHRNSAEREEAAACPRGRTPLVFAAPDVAIEEVVAAAETLVDLVVALRNGRGYVKSMKTLWKNGQNVEESER